MKGASINSTSALNCFVALVLESARTFLYACGSVLLAPSSSLHKRVYRSALRLFFLFSALVILSSCSSGKEPEKIAPELKSFNDYLITYYKNYAEEQSDRFDGKDSDHFEDKAERAEEGFVVEPDFPAERKIDEDVLEKLRDARGVLFDTVSLPAKKKEPRAAARAYFLYDCWLDAEEEEWRNGLVESCRNEFFEVINYLSVTAEDKKKPKANDNKPDEKGQKADDIEDGFADVVEDVEAKQAASSPEKPGIVAAQANPAAPSTPIVGPMPLAKIEAKVENASPAAPASVVANVPAAPIKTFVDKPQEIKQPDKVVLFDSDMDKLPDDAYDAIDVIMEMIKDKKEYRIVVNGHADRAEANDTELSVKRAKAMKDALVAKKIPEKNIQYFGYGDTDPEKQTADGIKEPFNRRVEIFVQ